MDLFLTVTLYSAAFIKDSFNNPSKKKIQISTSFSVNFLPVEHAVFLGICQKLKLKRLPARWNSMCAS